MFTRITPSKNGREALQYARGGENGKGHNNKEHRNLLVGGVNLLPDSEMSYEDQMEVFWKKASPRHKVQVRRIIGSFSKNELDPEDENSKYKAMEMATEFAEKFYPGRQAAIFIQDDGTGGCIHFHLIVNDCSMIDNKGCTIEQQKYWYVEKHFDELAKNYIELDSGKEQTKDKITQAERRKRKENQDAIEAGEPEKVQYIWRDDLKNRVQQAMEEATDRDDFLKRLTAHGVEGEYRSTKKNGDFIIYELTDLSGFEGDIPKKREYFKSKSYKMGDDYGLDALDRQIQENRQVTKEDVVQAYDNAVSTPRAEKLSEQISFILKDATTQTEVEIEPKHHTPKQEEPKQKTEEELEKERDQRLKTRFNYLAGIDFFKDHTTWETKDNFDELMKESDRRWSQFKEWYPEDYEERLEKGDISEPKPENKPTEAISETVNDEIPVKNPVKSHTEGVSGYKHSKKMAVQRASDASQPEQKTVAVPRREKEDKLQKQIDEVMAYGERIIKDEREKKAMEALNDFYNKK